jgi:general secretion pathway protein K
MGARQHGVALLVVLWACTLLAILVGGYAALSRTEALQVRNATAQQRVRYAAESGVMRAIVAVYAERRRAIHDADEANAAMAGGPPRKGEDRSFAFQDDGLRIGVSVTDETGKVDLNTADPGILRGLFLAAGCPTERAQFLADRVVEWRETLGAPDSVGRQRYAAAGLSYGPRHDRFVGIDELQSVLGIDAALYARVAPAITLWSGRASPEPEFAPLLAVAALPGMTLERARAFVAARDATATSGATLSIGGLDVGGATGGNAVTIHADAEDPQGVRAYVEATVRFDSLRAVRDPRRPLYTIVRWHDGVPGT